MEASNPEGARIQALCQRILDEVGKAVFGKDKEIREVLRVFLAGEHILLEDIPGVGKTTLALAFSRALSLNCKRVQFTPDVMPSDLTGFSVYHRETQQFLFHRGSLFTNLLLADEINRTSPKTQAALLEAMEERQVTWDGETHQLPDPFLVIATQNPQGSAGTQDLPEAELDRFAVMMSIGYPDYDSEFSMVRSGGRERRLGTVAPAVDLGTFQLLRKAAQQIYVSDAIYHYALDLVTATRHHPQIALGGSPRSTLILMKMARASAFLEGRNFVIPSDVAGQFPYVIRHRLILNRKAQMENVSRSRILQDILKSTPTPAMNRRRSS